MTRRYRESTTSASRRALLSIVGAIPLAVAVTYSSATGAAAAQPSVAAPPPLEQLRSSTVQHIATQRAIGTSAVWGPGRVHYGTAAPAPVLAPGGVPGRGSQAENAAAATRASIRAGLHPTVNGDYSDRVTRMTRDGGTAGLIIGAAAGAIPAAVFGAIPGAIIGATVGAIAGGTVGGVAMGIPTLGVGAPLGMMGGALAGAGAGAAVGAVVGAVVAAVPTAIVAGAAGYALGAATGNGNGQQS
ncbi:hypothetical protein KO481_06615 [Nocardia sp. NEAU-G5]|uniref:Elastin n=1 Tax=Nocardia albiluteola TaxID=2842303 RepID=A0ABS6AT31_9NOCA|nr:hypothetical protein [Nocardia albiluteola]MBU3061194.1 hypothetical protein [Nocardia albiluteola]